MIEGAGPAVRVPPRRVELDGGPGADGVIEDHFAYARDGQPQWLERAALRTKSFAARHVLARGALGRPGAYDAMIARLREAPDDVDSLDGFDLQLPWVLMLGRVMAFQCLDTDDQQLACRLMDSVHDRHGFSAFGSDALHTYAQLLFACGRPDRLEQLLPEMSALPERLHRYLRADLLNPFVSDLRTDRRSWESAFAACAAGTSLEAVRLGEIAATPFDSLSCHAPEGSVDGELISVIVTSFLPTQALLTATNSILRQTWRNLEVIVVDDGSPGEFNDLLDTCAGLCSRVRVVRLPSNGGTYVARNAGLSLARGAYITGQDADDWSHPRRLERQIAPIVADASVRASLSDCLRVTDQLQLTSVGYDPLQINSSSLMTTRATFDEVGFYDLVRKGADSEYIARIALGEPSTITSVPESLALVRLDAGSLSRRDFTPYWHHEARRSYRMLYEHWHQRLAVRAASRYLPQTPARRPFPAPAAFARDVPGTPAPAQDYDVIFLGDWRSYGGPARSMIEELRALRRHGYRIGIAHMEALWFMHNARPGPCEPILDLILAGEADLVQLDQGARADLLIVRYPPTLQFPPSTPARLEARQVLILANQTPSERDGSSRRYSVDACEGTVREMFGLDPLWVPQGPLIRRFIEPMVDPERIAGFDMPGIIDVDEWKTPRSRFRGDRPIIGRVSRDVPAKWPDNPDDILAAYPADDEFDVRILGGVKAPARVLGRFGVPASWLVYDNGEVATRQFLNQIDFFVYFHHPHCVEAFGRATLEAIAAGCTVVLPPHFEPVFGAAAVYCEAVGVANIVRTHWKNPAEFSTQARAAQGIAEERFGYAPYTNLVGALIATGRSPN